MFLKAGTNLFLNSIVLSTLCMGGYLMSLNEMTAGDLMSFLVASQTVQRSLAQISLLYGEVLKGLGAGASVFEVCLMSAVLDLKRQGLDHCCVFFSHTDCF